MKTLVLWLKKVNLQRWTMLVTVSIASSLLAPYAMAQQTEKAIKVRLGIASKDSAFSAALVAQETGIAMKHGLEIDFVNMAPPTIPAALIAGDLEFAAPAQTVARAAIQGLPVKTVAIMMDRPNYTLLADKSIQTVNDLRGMTIVTGAKTSQPGSILLELLEGLRINPKDVKILWTADPPLRRTLLFRRDAQAGLFNLDIAFKIQRQDANVHILIPAEKMPQTPFAGLSVSKKFLDSKPDVVERMIRAHLEANQFIKSKPKESQAIFARLFELTPAESHQLWDLLVLAIVPDGLMKDDLIKVELLQDARSLGRPDLTEAQVRAAFDMRITEKAARDMNLLRR